MANIKIMNFEEKQKSAVEEINVVLAKYGLGLNAYLDGYPAMLLPKIKFTELKSTDEAKVVNVENEKKTVKTKKGKK